jgi:dipeptidyl aminopeptidase/acylaminoacyl peptidase
MSRHARAGGRVAAWPRWLICLSSLSAIASRSTLAQETPSDTLLTVGHYFDLESVADPQISPDGSQIVYARRWVNRLEDRYETTLWIMRSDGTHARVFTKGSSPHWSPDGTRIAYLADGEPKGSQIFVRWVEGDPGPSQLTRADVGSEIGDLKWAPDGKSIGFTMFVAKAPQWSIDMPKPPDSAKWTKAPRIIETLHFREDRRGFIEEGYRHLYVVQTDGGPPRQITHGDWNVGARFDALSAPVGWDWSPDGRTIVFDGSTEPEGDYHYRESNLNVVDVATGVMHVLTHAGGVWTHPVISPDGRRIAYTGYPATRKTYQTSGLYIMNADGSDDHLVTGALDRDVGEVHWASDNSGVYFGTDDHGTRNLMFASGTGSPAVVRPVTSGPQIVSLGSVSRTGVAAVTVSTARAPNEVARVDLWGGQSVRGKTGTGAPLQLTHVNEAALSRIHLATPEEIWVTSSGGARIQGWVLKPPGFDPAQKYPLILEIHGGPHGDYNVGFSYMLQNFAANKFVVLYINPRGSTGYGSAFGAAISQDYPGVDYDDLMAAVDTVVGRGYVDTRNMFVGGCSGGGVLSSWVIGHTTRFAAAAVRCPVTDWISMSGETDLTLFTFGWFDKPYWEDPKPWLDHSSIMYVGHVTTPTLIMTGELDRRTPMPQSEEYYVALRMRHIPAVLLRFDSEYHGTGGMKPTNFLRTQLYMMSWYKRYMTPTAATAGAGGK